MDLEMSFGLPMFTEIFGVSTAVWYDKENGDNNSVELLLYRNVDLNGCCLATSVVR
jgi:hypothetical protein